MIFDFFVIVDFVWSGLRKKIKDLDWWFFLSYCGLLVVGVVDVCVVLVFFLLDVFIIILMSYLYYFNQIAKNIALLMLGVKRYNRYSSIDVRC